ncbi:hypothetical protein [Psychromicrobium sp. YIM B11713]|uniref:hypothetical protein n=1 Tax=Psychromicrobium sp. YIM B11713 TaxID=3145233 RepID=UPI00374E8088
MSTPPENPNPGQPGEQPVQPPADPYQAPGYQAPQGVPPEQPAAPQQPYQQPGYQAPQGAPQYQQPGQPQYQQPGQPGQGNFQFQLPTDTPKSFDEVLPKGGFSGIFNLGGLPQLLKISYVLWLITAGIWLLTTIFGFIGSLVLLGQGDNLFGVYVESGYYRGLGIRGIIISIIALVVIAAIVVFAMKLKEGLQWARFALTAVAVVSIILTAFGAWVSLIGIVATVLMWLPESTAWLNSRRSAPPVG